MQMEVLKREDTIPGQWYPITLAPTDHHLLLAVNERCATELGHYNTALGRWVAAWDHRPLHGVTDFQYVPELPKPECKACGGTGLDLNPLNDPGPCPACT